MATRLVCGLVAKALLGLGVIATAAEKASSNTAAQVELFDAMKQGDVDVKFIAKNDRDAKLIIENKTKQPIELKLPEAFAGVHVLAQQGGFGGGGGGFGGGGGGGNQSVGGGGGGFGGGGGGFGGGGGAFSIPPEKIAKIDMPVVCLEHGKPDPSSSNTYEIRPIETVVDRPEVIELLKAFGKGKLDHGAVQAAAWNLNNDLSWNELAAKQTGTQRSARREPYFSRDQLQMAVAYASKATQLAKQNADQYDSLADGGSLADEAAMDEDASLSGDVSLSDDGAETSEE